MPEERLDVRLSRETGMTRSRVETLIREGRAQVNGAVEKNRDARSAKRMRFPATFPRLSPLKRSRRISRFKFSTRTMISPS